MSKRLNLREFQQNLSNRMNARDRASDRVSSLGVLIAGQNWLINMADISEVMPMPPMTHVPFSKAWFRGVANVRGNLYGIADLAAYQKKGTASGDMTNRILLVAERHGFNTALLIDRVMGLRDTQNWRHDTERDQYLDSQGTAWRKLDVVAMLQQTDFLQIGA